MVLKFVMRNVEYIIRSETEIGFGIFFTSLKDIIPKRIHFFEGLSKNHVAFFIELDFFGETAVFLVVTVPTKQLQIFKRKAHLDIGNVVDSKLLFVMDFLTDAAAALAQSISFPYLDFPYRVPGFGLVELM